MQVTRTSPTTNYQEQKKYQHMKQGMIQLQAVIRGGATRQNVEQIRSAKKLQMLAVDAFVTNSFSEKCEG